MEGGPSRLGLLAFRCLARLHEMHDGRRGVHRLYDSVLRIHRAGLRVAHASMTRMYFVTCERSCHMLNSIYINIILLFKFIDNQSENKIKNTLLIISNIEVN